MRVFRTLARFCLWLLVFLVGITGGVYYHQEIAVVVNHLWPGGTVSTPSVTPPPINRQTQSILDLPMGEAAIPLVFSDTLEEGIIQDYLKEGAVVLPLGTTFGEPGNVVVTAHSTGSAGFGPYRFAFAKLADLKAEQEFTISTPQATYTYKVYGQDIVWPHEVDRLPQDDRSTVTLVTCWPLWTNFKRLLVHAELTNIQYKI